MNGIWNPDPCLTAQTIRTGPIDPDVGGIAVGASNIAINVLLPILLRWSKHDLKTSIFMLLSQIYPILIATASSIGTGNLTLFDSRFAIAVTASPVSIYFVYSSFRDVFRRPNLLYYKLSSQKGILRCLGLLLPVLWLFVNLMTSFYTKAFIDSSACQGMTLSMWLNIQVVSNLGFLDILGKRDLINDIETRGGLGMLSLVCAWIWAIYVVRHRDDIYDEYQTRRLESHSLPTWQRVFFTFWDVPMASWFVVTHAHPWMIFLIVCLFHWSWTLGIARGLTFDGYQFNYGQVTSVFSIIPPFIAVGELLVQQSGSICIYLKNMPQYCWIGARFLLTGRPNPWDQLMSIPTRRVSWSSRQWLGVIVLWLTVSALQAAWIMEYVKAGSKPNPHVFTQHKFWKPFSICLYVSGYLICYINILVWASYFELVRWWNPREMTAGSRMGAIYKKILKHLNRAFHVTVVLPIAFIMCAGPLFGGSAALPLAQQYQWTHVCDSFAGEAILRSPSLDSPGRSIMSFYYPENPESTTRIHYFDYTMTSDLDSPTQILSFDGTAPQVTVPADLQPNILSVSYASTGQSNSISAMCTTTVNNTAVPIPCMTGTFYATPYLNFSLQDSFTGNTTYLRAVQKEWRFASSDAPSFVLRYASLDPSQPLGDIAIQTGLTQRSHCEVLKLCLGSRKLGFDILAPLGVALIAQNDFAAYCTLPQLYNI